MSWSLASDIADSDSAIAMYERVDGEQKLQGQTTQGSQPDFTSHEQPLYQADGNFVGDSVKIFCCGSLHEHNHSFDSSLMEPEPRLNGSDSVICRICEEAVPISHLESHSYICAYADKSALNCIDVDEHLVKLAEYWN
ncbi:hypothetical protein V6N13_139030 [Hibiscus sabdariffa]